MGQIDSIDEVGQMMGQIGIGQIGRMWQIGDGAARCSGWTRPDSAGQMMGRMMGRVARAQVRSDAAPPPRWRLRIGRGTAPG
eukprot:scaffold132465_cov48-Phaeocystis_antarctica.AAC.2